MAHARENEQLGATNKALKQSKWRAVEHMVGCQHQRLVDSLFPAHLAQQSTPKHPTQLGLAVDTDTGVAQAATLPLLSVLLPLVYCQSAGHLCPRALPRCCVQQAPDQTGFGKTGWW